MPPPAATVLIPVLVTAAWIATACTFAALLTAMNTLFWVAGLSTVAFLAGCAFITERAEHLRRLDGEGSRRERADYRASVWARREREAGLL